MEKLICQIYTENTDKAAPSIRKTFLPVVKKYKRAIAYHNCKVCHIDFDLTSSGKNFLSKDSLKLIKTWNNGIMDPRDKKYQKTYSDILNKASANNFNMSGLLYFSLFTKDLGLLPTTIPSIAQQMPATQVFEALININEPHKGSTIGYKEHYTGFKRKGSLTGYKEYYLEFNDIKITNSTGNTFFMDGVLDKSSTSETFTVNNGVVAYLVRDKVLSCVNSHSEANTYSSERFDGLIDFIKKGLIESLNMQLIYDGCDIEHKPSAFIELSEEKNIDKIRTICEAMGGAMISARDLIESICQKPVVLAEHPLFSITCSNYKDILTFDDSTGRIADYVKTNALSEPIHDEF